MSANIPQLRSLLLELLDRAFDKISWHGPNLSSALRGVTPKLATRRIGRRKCIWEQALHAAYWKQRVINKLAGTQRFPRPGSNWPRMPARFNQRAWKLDLELLLQIHRRLRDCVAAMPPNRFTPKIISMIQGVAFHDVYHAGQIKLLRRLLQT